LELEGWGDWKVGPWLCNAESTKTGPYLKEMFFAADIDGMVTRARKAGSALLLCPNGQGARMHWIGLVFPVVLLAFTGCEAVQLETKTTRMSATLSELQYSQVLDNLARVANNPSALPYFNVAATGKTTVQQTGQGSAGANLDLITTAGIAAIVNKFILDKANWGIQLTQQDVMEWDTSPAIDPVQLLVMQGLYRKVLGIQPPPFEQALMEAFFAVKTKSPSGPVRMEESFLAPPPKTEVGPANTPKKIEQCACQQKQPDAQPQPPGAKEGYTGPRPVPIEFTPMLNALYNSLGPGWVGVGCKKDVPRDACYVGHHCNTYIWVRPDGMESLTNLTIAIIDVVTTDTSAGSGNARTTPSNLARAGIGAYFGNPNVIPPP
jgi:hypothetical protein